ncbi:hypothetical protein CYPRO_0081 [Cyclonatronum proteinivorum]|uniref:Uncharacterized protein n=1 Tax=Cyclonatronum proteinivorum TaxID=1457365 RepID=A0A345UFW8_9BACT|nr:hypothetical protein [Cyclonatronum proteinivorum]AXI99369.1 hypothetical protein CYPRO_0081 [Cyclonatronum proteinivorum]
MNDWFVNFFMFFGAMCFLHFVLDLTWSSFFGGDFVLSVSNLITYTVISVIAGSLRWRQLRKQAQG